MAALLYVIFFVSGASALIFEMLWFRQAGLAFGNSVWASSLVLSAFMGGLALGNAAAARYGTRVENGVRLYALAEVAIATTGVALVFLLPVLGVALAPLLRPLLDHPWILNPVRLAMAFLLLLVPSTAMGITLPLLIRAVMGDDRSFGRALGRLYGWNTLGAVVGVLAGELYLIRLVGVRGTAVVAATLNLMAAAVAMWISTRQADLKVGIDTDLRRGRPSGRPAIGGSRSQWLAAAFLSGFCLLALEVIWFRFLLLFVKGHSTALALMLGIILAGISLGGLAAAVWLRITPTAHRLASAVAILAGTACLVSYAAFPRIIEAMPSLVVDPWDILNVAAPLLLPVSFLSGIVFTLLGAGLRGSVASDSQAAGTLTLANTAGAACGSLTAGFVLLPLLGMERSFFLIAVLYGSIGVLLSLRAAMPRLAVYGSAAVLLVSMAFFPFGAMETRLLDAALRPWRQADPTARVAAVREGVTETVIYFRRDMLGRPVSHAMLTNSFSMSATGYGARRYMKLYVYWPMAVHPDLKRALLIGYGVGNTAKAMTDARTLDTIDIVDLSRDILEMNQVVYPNGKDHPLNDPRVRVHIEDGRYLLQTTDRVFDLITGEPPPPGIAGVENLYTREYFQLVRGRLADGGLVTYWLPLSDLSDASAKAILRAFCDVFEDCSLWNGSGTHLMMVGTHNAAHAPSEEQFRRQWMDPTVAAEMKQIGLEQPEQLGALFIGDAEYLRALVGDSPPLTDNYPRRIESSSAAGRDAILRDVTDTRASAARFETSPLIARLWPEPLRAASRPYFAFQDVINAHMYGELLPGPNAIQDVHRVLTTSSLTAPVLWRLGSNADVQQVVESPPPDQAANPLVHFHVGIRLLSERHFAAAAQAFRQAAEYVQPAAPGTASTGDNAFALYIYALCMAGQTDEAQELIRGPWEQSLTAQGLDARSAAHVALPPFWAWMRETFGIDPRR
jgi:spermidine synthase